MSSLSARSLSSSPTSLPNVDLQPGRPPILRVEATGDAERWASEHRNALRAFVAEHGSLLVRNYNNDIGASVAEAFGADDRRAVESYCRANAIQFEWQQNGELRTWQRRSAVVRHPRTGQRCWFNQIAFLNEWTMDPEVREYLVDTYGEDGLPFNTRFGNGDPIGADVIQLIDEVYEANTARERWQG